MKHYILPFYKKKRFAMENLRLYVFTGILGAVLVICSGFTLFHILKIKFEDKIEQFFESLENEIKLTFPNCNEAALRGELYVADEKYIAEKNGAELLEVDVEDMLCQNSTGNNELSHEFQFYCNASQTLDARMDILESTISTGGKKGENGNTGTDGSPGLNGEKGTEGKTGQQGNRGTQGIKGGEGTKGFAGVDGDKGVGDEQGPAGPKGDRGETGTPGLPGIEGEPAGDGFPGLDGRRGRLGPPGKKGKRGEIGRKGDKGESSFSQLVG